MNERKKRKWPYILAGIPVVLCLVYFMGPKPAKPDFSKLRVPALTTTVMTIGDSIINAEDALDLKEGNDARIFWIRQFEKTPYAFVYLHGNGASPQEGDPIHEGLAHLFGANLFEARLAEHGIISADPLKNITSQAWLQSALDAVAVGHVLGDKVILISTSTGSTLALNIAAHYPDLVDGLILMSPNIDMYDPRSKILARPWGLQMARQITGSPYYSWDAPASSKRFWYTSYRLEALTELKTMINATMNEETFKAVKQPVMMAYYYQDEEHQDHIVSVKRMKEMFEQLGTPADQKREVAVADANTHIIGSDLFNKNLESVWIPITVFCDEVLKMPRVNDSDYTWFSDSQTR